MLTKQIMILGGGKMKGGRRLIDDGWNEQRMPRRYLCKPFSTRKYMRAPARTRVYCEAHLLFQA